MKKTGKYTFSFTAGGLLLNESTCLATLFLELGNWEDVREKAIKDNLLQRRTASSSKRIFSEIRRRLRHLSEREMSFFLSSSIDDKRAMAFVAICRHYRFIYDYIVEIVRYNHLNGKTKLERNDYDRFTAQVELIHPEYEKLTDKTKNKVRQVLHGILREVGLLSSAGDDGVTPFFVSRPLGELLSDSDPSILAVFLLSDEQIEKVLKNHGR